MVVHLEFADHRNRREPVTPLVHYTRGTGHRAALRYARRGRASSGAKITRRHYADDTADVRASIELV